MRVIAGKYKSRQLKSVPGVETRPTSDRLRETLFNVLAQRMPGSVWVDLFAGTGAVGIEALSRGAKSVHFVESEKKAARVIRDNIQALKIDDEHEIFESRAADAVKMLEREVKAGIIFLDPPWDNHGSYEQMLRLLSNSPLLSDDAIVIAEHEKHFDPGDGYGELQRYRTLRQGDAVLSFYRRATDLPSRPSADSAHDTP
jgi:16S rRNA (guanine966-N2)-methyltransferase